MAVTICCNVARVMRKREDLPTILWVQTELLHPVDKGGRIRTYHMLRELKRHARIAYLSLDDGSASPDAHQRATEYCDELIVVPHQMNGKFSAGFYFDLARNLASPLPYVVQKYRSPELRRQVEAWIERNAPDVIVCDFLAAAVNLPERYWSRSVLFQHNVEAMIWKRHVEVQHDPAKRAYLRLQRNKMLAFERATCRAFGRVIAVSEVDAEWMRREYGVEHVFDIPTGVDTEYFRPSGQIPVDPYNLVFTGSMDWLPNEDAIRYFTTEVLQRVRAAVPGVTLTVVGRNPYPSLVDLARRDPSLQVTGRVEDVRPYIERAAAYVIPIRIGGGTRLKVYEAMAMEKAIVSTSIGAEGLPVRDGEDVLLADTAEDLAAAVVRVLQDRALARRLGLEAARAVRAAFGWERVSAKFLELCLYGGHSHGPRIPDRRSATSGDSASSA